MNTRSYQPLLSEHPPSSVPEKFEDDSRIFFISRSDDSPKACRSILGGDEPLYSPAQDAVKYENRVFTQLGVKTIYHGPPTDETDKAWNALYPVGMSRITKAEAKLLPNWTEPIPGDEEHHLVILEVFHELHCLNEIRKALSPERYGAAELGEPILPHDSTPFDHIDHCVNILRESVMCHADITPNVFQWDDYKKQSFIHFDSIHTCRSWEAIGDWAADHKMAVEWNKFIHVGHK